MEPQQQCGLLESLGRAVEEVEALESIYGYDEGGFEVVSEAALALARVAVDGGATAEDWQAPPLDIELQLQIEPDEEAAAVTDGRCETGSTARLRCGLPPACQHKVWIGWGDGSVASHAGKRCPIGTQPAPWRF